MVCVDALCCIIAGRGIRGSKKKELDRKKYMGLENSSSGLKSFRSQYCCSCCMNAGILWTIANEFWLSLDAVFPLPWNGDTMLIALLSAWAKSWQHPLCSRILVPSALEFSAISVRCTDYSSRWLSMSDLALAKKKVWTWRNSNKSEDLRQA